MKTTMKALVKANRGEGAELREVPIPSPKEDEVLVKVTATAICGTDIHIYKWDNWSDGRIKPPLTFGHEFCGEIVETGSKVTDLEVGTRVTAEGHFVCGSCYFCKTGQAHICEDVEIIGVDTEGCFAEYLVVPRENVWVLDPKIPEDVAAIHDPLGNAVHATLIDEIVGNDVLITGCGPIGLASIAVAKKAGASQVIVTDINSYRLSLAKEMGADLALNPQENNVVEEVMKNTQNQGVDVLLEMAGHNTAINDGLKALKGGGWVSFLGIPGGQTQIDLADGIIFKGAKAYGINGRLMYDTWYKMHKLLKGGLIEDLEPLITHKFSLDEYEKAFELAKQGNTGKIILYP
ncbi:L-threonine 3-dehydrogenase [Natranaerobius trueperi]|uniref:L-threonine 3-dehydrogenase n=1 Tax=Natranaerobius trueperi TaxID=759412 RepID=A0A226BUZ2_9FIRM|nr:L-threonine 3-dehydrogenase [Natranaerobius trueperi]OWZ82795.1 L-threonine 3-dehydrogenase [Natranaerobius trueperi]